MFEVLDRTENLPPGKPTRHYRKTLLRLAQYGPETKPVRDRLKNNLTRSNDLFWGGGEVDPQKLTAAAAVAELRSLGDNLSGLDPKTPAQRQAVSTAGSARSHS